MVLKMVADSRQVFVCDKLAHGMARQGFVLRQHRIEIRQSVEGYRLHNDSYSPGQGVTALTVLFYAVREQTSLLPFACWPSIMPPHTRGTNRRTCETKGGDTAWQVIGGKNRSRSLACRCNCCTADREPRYWCSTALRGIPDGSSFTRLWRHT